MDSGRFLISSNTESRTNVVAIRIDNDGEEMDGGPDDIDVWEFVPDLYEQIMATTQPEILRVRVVNPPMFDI